ncbi:MAG: CgeB family protein [Candidatus Helarchaeota archaeon]
MKILLCAPYIKKKNPYGLLWYKTFKRLNYEVEIYDYRYNAYFFNRGKGIFNKYNSLNKIIKWRTFKKLKKKIEKFKPEALIVFKGELLDKDIINFIRKEYNIFAILIFPDDPQLFDSVSSKIAPAYDYVFTFSWAVLPKYRELGIKNISCIPFAIDPDIYHRIELTNNELEEYGSDLSFVGTMYKNREEILKSVIGYNLKIWGKGWEKSIYPEIRKKFTHRFISIEEISKVFNACKINLNIHHNSGNINFRCFEITGCGAFCLTDRTLGIEKSFEIGKEIITYEGNQDLIEKIDYYLDNDTEREEIAIRGQQRTYRDHTIEKRLKQVINVIK